MSMSAFIGAGTPRRANPLARVQLRSRLAHWALSFLAAIGLFGAAGLLVAGLREAAPRAPEAAAAPKSAWVEFGRPIQIYALQTAEFGKEVRVYEARRHREGGGRQDLLSYGAAEIGQGANLRLSLYRPGTEPAPETALFVDFARLAARSGLAVTRSALPDTLATRFGAFEVSDVSLAQGQTEAPCLGFRLNVADPGLQIAGFACGGARPVDRPTLACALDRLDLVAAGDDRELAKFFIAAEQARGKACGPARGPGAKPTWLDPSAHLPPLRNAGAGQRIVAR